MHLHLDLVGGISGDMFIAALLDSHQELEPHLETCLQAIGLDQKVSVKRYDHNNGVLTGSRVLVKELENPQHYIPSRFRLHDHSHNHQSFSDIRKLLLESKLTEPVQKRAINIFTRLAQAESQVHGVPVEDVTFHEVGSLDSIADITLAACLIECLGYTSWSVGSIPMGSGRINCQHGILPIPAPATLLLLQGLPLFDDGISGERITPTGAAILSHLQPDVGGPANSMKLMGSGTGFGTAKLTNLPNILRVMTFESLRQWGEDEVGVYEFEIDDQTPEDLAVGLQNLRKLSGVLDVIVVAATAKKNRQVQSIRILGEPNHEQIIIASCYDQTTTLGVRHYRCSRSILNRQEVKIGDARIKIAERPSGHTAKVDIDDLERMYRLQASRSDKAHELKTVALDNHDKEFDQ